MDIKEHRVSKEKKTILKDAGFTYKKTRDLYRNEKKQTFIDKDFILSISEDKLKDITTEENDQPIFFSYKDPLGKYYYFS